MITKKDLIKKLKRFSLDTEFELIRYGNYLCLIVKETGEVIEYVEYFDSYTCQNF